ncbi:DUF3048 domain-containing protein [Streptomyces sp. TX20-6-3]|uniref:DUF3048 domain-containing protein n=1 Tax=Streptomyces sp. TX20-6-3 TaxID=3028705 RepID=UPI0029B272BF|nr:DUF3048 domain-containing protein [Streptomyces sp. TX20-6-3]MDX2565189.1 DUF3048 domain-containing protein [Streptomyces sp. TX20-6-3]
MAAIVPVPVPGTGVSPYTGLPARIGPVLAVKIDNVQAARPHTGVDAADLVYVEQVEAGQSRILAVYSSALPPKVGPVRSARESDLELLIQFGSPILAYSGSQTALKPLIKSAPLFALPPEAAPAAFTRDPNRFAPHNLYLNPSKARAAVPGAVKAQDIGFRFGPPPAGGITVNHHAVRFPAASFDFTWSGKRRQWMVSMDGETYRTPAGAPIGTPTVVVQNVDVHPSRFKDRWGSVSPYTETVGRGTATVLRDGRSFKANWSRPNSEAKTTFTTLAGEPMNFAPGQVWVLLTAR